MAFQMKMYNKISDANIEGKRILLRADLNVPLKTGHITSDVRIERTVPTIEYLLSKNPKQIVICSHLGRPEGKMISDLSLKPVFEWFSRYFDDVHFEREPIMNIEALPENKIILLENLRFDKRENKNDKMFSKKLASLADIFVLDAFGTLHRKHASVVGVQQYIPSYAGHLVENELLFLDDKLKHPKKPFVVIIAGKKEGKIKFIKNFLSTADYIILGGVVANTFLKAKNCNIGNCDYAKDHLDFAKMCLEKYEEKIFFPEDYVIGKSINDLAERVATRSDRINDNYIFDIGPKTIETYKNVLSRAKTVLFGGPLGVFENEQFENGTKELAQYIAGFEKVIKIVVGGDTALAMEKFDVATKMSHISTGGGASLKLVSGGKMHGLIALENNMQLFPNDEI